jgi:hypothetical protein
LRNSQKLDSIPEDELARVCSKLQKAKECLQEFHLLIQMRIPELSPNSKKHKRAAWLLAKSKLTKMKGKLEDILNELRRSLGQLKTYDPSLILVLDE